MTEKKSKFNVKVGNGFSNDAFGEGSIKVDLTAEGIKAFVENAQVGGAILVKYNRETVKGNKHYFIELLEPYVRATAPTNGNGKTTTGKVGKTSQLD